MICRMEYIHMFKQTKPVHFSKDQKCPYLFGRIAFFPMIEGDQLLFYHLI